MTGKFYTEADYARVTQRSAVAGNAGSLPQNDKSDENAEPYRSDFRRDYARIVHSPGFRRLQRKTQLFPGEESDFFRNRLTHSLEVAQIAKSIAIRLNSFIHDRHGEALGYIDTDLVEVAGLAHDMGHPPFGHTGENALHERMYKVGGFEGNAQTLRLVSKLEKRRTIQPLNGGSSGFDFVEFRDGADLRAGLDLTYRSLASILKYDKAITFVGADAKLMKGYYQSEADLVYKIRSAVLGQRFEELKTEELQVIEMQIMDIADDIAYSTYDFEDALKAGFGSPVDLLQQMNENADLRNAVGRKLFKNETGREYISKDAAPSDKTKLEEIQQRMVISVSSMLRDYLLEVDRSIVDEDRDLLINGSPEERSYLMAAIAVNVQRLSEAISKDGYVRSQFTSDMIGKRIRAIDIDINTELPCASKIEIDAETKFQIEVLKHVTFELHIKSPRLKLIEYRGNQIVNELFECFERDKEGDLLPGDWRRRLQQIQSFSNSEELRQRLICDYIACMTDGYALDVYSRLKTTNPSALFRPT